MLLRFTLSNARALGNVTSGRSVLRMMSATDPKRTVAANGSASDP
jgi:hypothetical protein